MNEKLCPLFSFAPIFPSTKNGSDIFFCLTLNDRSFCQTLLHSLPRCQIFTFVNHHDVNGPRVFLLSVDGIFRVANLFVDGTAFSGPQEFSPCLADFFGGCRPQTRSLSHKIIDAFVGIIVGAALALFLLHPPNCVFQAFFFLFFVGGRRVFLLFRGSAERSMGKLRQSGIYRMSLPISPRKIQWQ